MSRAITTENYRPERTQEPKLGRQPATRKLHAPRSIIDPVRCYCSAATPRPSSRQCHTKGRADAVTSCTSRCIPNPLTVATERLMMMKQLRVGARVLRQLHLHPDVESHPVHATPQQPPVR
jgi:hypothetical protein